MDKEKFLELIRQIESSGGTDVQHPRMPSGIHKGESAMGQYGIMPKTAEEFVNRRRLHGEFGPDEAIMKQMSPEELKQFLADNQRVETNLAKDVSEHVLKRSKGDEEKAAYMWNMGHNKKASSIDEESLAEHPYVRKFKRLKALLDSKKSSPAEELKNSNIIP